MPAPSAAYPYPTQLGTLPPSREGSKALTVPVAWSGLTPLAGPLAPLPWLTTTINLLAAFQGGQFTTVQAVLIDNTTNSCAVTLISLETGQRVTCGRFAQVISPLVCGPAPEFEVRGYPTGNVTLNASTFVQSPLGTTRITFFNTPHGYSSYVSKWQDQAGLPIFAGGAAVTANVAQPLYNTPQPEPSQVGGVALLTGLAKLQITAITSGGGYNAGAIVAMLLDEDFNGAVPGTVIWRDTFQPSTAAAALVYSNVVTFDPPLLTSNPNHIYRLTVPFVPPVGNLLLYTESTIFTQYQE